MFACCLAGTTAPLAHAASYDIYMTAYGFDPDYLEVHLGDTVYWWNVDYDFYDDHSTRSYTYPWNSGPVPVDHGVYLTVTKLGTFDYVDDWGYSGWGTLVVSIITPPAPPLPPVLTDAVVLPDGTFQCTVSNLVAGNRYYVQASTNLQDWTAIYNGVAPGPTDTYFDSAAPGLARRFYRVVTVP
jgi:plastocyanin